jgi:hypothetical protein
VFPFYLSTVAVLSAVMEKTLGLTLKKCLSEQRKLLIIVEIGKFKEATKGVSPWLVRSIRT